MTPRSDDLAREPRHVPTHGTALYHGASLTARHGDMHARPDRITPEWLARHGQLKAATDALVSRERRLDLLNDLHHDREDEL